MLNTLRFVCAAVLILGGAASVVAKAPEHSGTSLMFGVYVLGHALIERGREARR